MSKLSGAIKEEFDADMRTIAELQKRIGELEAERDSLKLQAVAQAQEMRSHKSSLHEAYQYITGATGEPGNWNGARPIKEAVDKLRQALTAERQRREAVEAIARDHVVKTTFQTFARELKAYFARYPSGSDNREKVRFRVGEDHRHFRQGRAGLFRPLPICLRQPREGGGMSRRPARFTEAEINRATRIAEKRGPDWTVDILRDGTIRILRRVGDEEEKPKLGEKRRIVL
jgi:hypothetical protein